MSYPETGSTGSLSPIIKSGTSSFRVRQLISMLVLVALGTSLLGGGYLSLFFENHNSKIQKAQAGIAEELLLHVPVFSDDIIRTKSDVDELTKLLKHYRFSDGQADNGTKDELFAYFQDPKTGNVKWQSKFPLEAYDQKNTEGLNDYVEPFGLQDIDPTNTNFHKVTVDVVIDGIEKPHTYIVYSNVYGLESEEKVRLVLAQSAINSISEIQHVQYNIIALFFSTLFLVLVAQLISNYFIITPIKEFETEVKEIEAGAQDAILKAYPIELTEVKSAINTLINVEKGQKQRYRESLDNLAHSLKTPLAAVLSAQSKYDMKENDQEDLKKSINHMCDIVAYQLKRTRAPTCGEAFNSIFPPTASTISALIAKPIP